MKTGTYGRVTLVRDKAGGPTMALKQIQKAHIVRGGKVQNLILEKRVMQMCDHQFLLKLHRSFQDQASIFLLTEFVQVSGCCWGNTQSNWCITKMLIVFLFVFIIFFCNNTGW